MEVEMDRVLYVNSAKDKYMYNAYETSASMSNVMDSMYKIGLYETFK